MKILAFELNKIIYDFVFPNNRVKTRRDLIRICLETCRNIMAESPLPDATPQKDRIILKVEKMSRFFYFTEDKYISICIPIVVHVMDNKPLFIYNDKEIDSELLSWLISCQLRSEEDLLSDEDYQLFLWRCEENNFDFFSLFKLFMEAEYGYIRYEIDAKRFNSARNKGKPHSHPLCHYDIHLSNHATFKLGCIKNISPTLFIDMLDNTKDR